MSDRANAAAGLSPYRLIPCESGIPVTNQEALMTDTAAMPCPVCRVPLVMSERQGVEIDYCPQCRGVWLDRGELDKIVERNARTALRALHHPRLIPITAAAPIAATATTIIRAAALPSGGNRFSRKLFD
jgi:hypothetical protein